jgi:hypothetical protein
MSFLAQCSHVRTVERYVPNVEIGAEEMENDKFTKKVKEKIRKLREASVAGPDSTDQRSYIP